MDLIASHGEFLVCAQKEKEDNMIPRYLQHLDGRVVALHSRLVFSSYKHPFYRRHMKVDDDLVKD